MRWRLSVLARYLGNTQGQVIVLAAGAVFMLTGFATLSIDLGYYTSERQRLQNALDAAALAGAQHLPESVSAATEAASRYAEINDPEIETLDITFGCLVNSDATGAADRTEIFALCPQLEDEEFNCEGDRCFHRCEVTLAGEADGETCNTILVAGSKTVSLFLAPAIGFKDSPTAELRSIACGGRTCGAPADALIVLLIDRSNTMNTPPNSPESRFNRAKRGAASILNPEFLIRELHVVALVTTPILPNGDHVLDPPLLTDEYDVLVGLLDDLDILDPRTQPGVIGTDLHTPVDEANRTITGHDRASEVRNRIIILLTDGKPDGSGGTPCSDAFEAAARAKDANIQIFTIFVGNLGQSSDRCTDSGDIDLSAIELLAEMASGHEAGDAQGICEGTTSPSDTFICDFEGDDLTIIFQRIIRRVTDGTGSSLINLAGLI